MTQTYRRVGAFIRLLFQRFGCQFFTLITERSPHNRGAIFDFIENKPYTYKYPRGVAPCTPTRDKSLDPSLGALPPRPQHSPCRQRGQANACPPYRGVCFRRNLSRDVPYSRPTGWVCDTTFPLDK